MTEANSISFNFTGGTYQLIIGNFSAFKNLNFVSSGTTGFGGTLLAHNSADFTIFGNLTLSSNMTHASSILGYLFAATSGTQIVTSNGKTFDMPMAQTGVGGTTKLADAFVMGATRTFNFVNGNFDGNGQTITGALLLSASGGGVTSFKGLNTARPFTVTNSTTTFTSDNTTGAFGFTTGTLNLGGYILTALSFNSSNGNTRTLNFSTSTINVTNTAGGTLWTTATVTNLTVTGTPVVNISNSGAVSTTVATGSLNEANAISFNFTTGTYTLTWTGSAKNVNFTGFAGAWDVTTNNAIYGNLTLSSSVGFSITNGTGITTFGATSGTQIITSNTKTFDANFTVNGVGGTVQLFDDLIVGSTRNTVLTNGTLDLNGKKLTTGFFISSNSNTRTIAFGSSNITCNAAGGTIWTTQVPTNLTVTGTPVVNISYSGSVATTVNTGPLTESQAISFNFTTGTYALSFLNSPSYTAKSANFTGFSGTLNGFAGSVLLYGSLTLSSSMTLTTSVNALTFAATSGSYAITSSAKTLPFPVTFNGVGGTWQLADALTLGSTALLLNNGTFDGNGKTISGTLSFTMTTGSVTMKGVSTTGAFGMNTGTLTQGSDNTTGAFSLVAGTLALGSFKLTCTTFSSSGGGVRTIDFGTGNVTCNAAGGTLWTTATVTNLTVTGTPVVNISNSGAVATTVATGTLNEANAISFNFTTGTYALTFLGTASHSAKNVNFTGFAGTWNARTVASVIYGSLTLSTGMTFAASSGVLTFGATSGTQILTSNAKTIDEPITINGVGGTVQLADALLMGTTRILAHTNGTLDLNGKTLTVGTQYQTVAGTQVLTFNGGTLTCPGVTTLAFNNAVPAGFTTTAGTGTGKISMTGATAKTFVGGGSTYDCTLSNDGAGALTISGENTFTTIANGVQPTAFVFPISVTQTVTNWNVSGTAGNLVTITSGTAGTAATLSKASGTVSSNYLSLKDSTATGGATWYAGANSTNVSGNSGWIFSAPPVVTAGGNFFFMF
jgi:hypothetical protein